MRTDTDVNIWQEGGACRWRHCWSRAAQAPIAQRAPSSLRTRTPIRRRFLPQRSTKSDFAHALVVDTSAHYCFVARAARRSAHVDARLRPRLSRFVCARWGATCLIADATSQMSSCSCTKRLRRPTCCSRSCWNGDAARCCLSACALKCDAQLERAGQADGRRSAAHPRARRRLCQELDPIRVAPRPQAGDQGQVAALHSVGHHRLWLWFGRVRVRSDRVPHVASTADEYVALGSGLLKTLQDMPLGRLKPAPSLTQPAPKPTAIETHISSAKMNFLELNEVEIGARASRFAVFVVCFSLTRTGSQPSK